MSLDDLLALIRARATPDAFPDKDELHALLEPFRALPDQEHVRLALGAALRKGNRLVARVAAQALAHLGGAAATPLLVGIATDERLGLGQRAAAVWAIGNVHPDAFAGLSADEQLVCSSLPVLEMLDDPAADGGFGFEALRETYERFPGSERMPFVGMIAELARTQRRPVAPVVMHLLKAEADPGRRHKLLDLVAADHTQEAADLLAAFAARASDARERQHVARQLRVLSAKGLVGAVHADHEDVRVFVTGTDGDACCSVTFIVPRAPTFDIATLLLHLGTGIRDAFVRRHLPGRSVDELLEATRLGCDDVAAFLPLPLGARVVGEVLALPGAAGAANPDIEDALAFVTPLLERGQALPYVEPEAPDDLSVGSDEVRALLDGDGFESWFFEAGETTIRKSIEALRKPIRGKGEVAATTVRRRLEAEATKICARLRDGDEPDRLARMLRHQARVFEAAGNGQRGTICRALGVEVSRPESVFLMHMAVRSLIGGLRARPDEGRHERYLDARAHLRGRMPETPRRRKADVARLDFAAAAHVELNLRNREAPSAKRASLNVIEAAALDVAAAFADQLAAPAPSPLSLEKSLVAILAAHGLFGRTTRRAIAIDVLQALAAFIDGLCAGECPHGCLEDPNADGAALFYSRELPWDVDADAVHRRVARKAKPSA